MPDDPPADPVAQLDSAPSCREIFGFPVVVDHSLPPDTIEIRGSKGSVWITGLAADSILRREHEQHVRQR